MVHHVQPEVEAPRAVAQEDLPAPQVQAVLHVLVPDGRQAKRSESVIGTTSRLLISVATTVCWQFIIRLQTWATGLLRLDD